MTYLAVPIPIQSPQHAIRDIHEAVAGGAELLELRFDYLPEPSQQDVTAVINSAKETRLPVITTCRPHFEGGQVSLPDEVRLDVFEWAIGAGTDYIDIELACLEDHNSPFLRLLKIDNVKIIISYHDFKTTPADLDDRIEKIKKHNPDIIKIAYMPSCVWDCFYALDILHEQDAIDQPAIALAMGECGIMSRLLAKKLNGFLTFAGLTENQQTAPGQMSLATYNDLYNWDTLNRETVVFGVIGSPLGHSMSPAIHNGSFKACAFDGLYLPFEVNPDWDSFKRFMDELLRRPWLDVRGLSITIPHKAHALRYVSEIGGSVEPLADRIGAVNTIVISGDGHLTGSNTDYAGALDAITSVMGIEREQLAGLSVALIGAGGVARAIAAGLCDQKADVTIYNRTVEKASELAEQFGCRYRSMDDLEGLDCWLIINCTSIGMHPQPDESPVPAQCIIGDMIVFDTVYNPVETVLLKEAREVGATTIDGVEMFVNQAAMQFELFCGRVANRKFMRSIVEKHLS